MAAVETAAGGASLTVIFVALLGPMAGPYVLIVFAAVAGAMWPLSAARTDTRWQGFWLLLRCTATALVLTSVISGVVEWLWGLPVSEGLAPVALVIGAMGNGWRPVFISLAAIVQGVIDKGGRQ